MRGAGVEPRPSTLVMYEAHVRHHIVPVLDRRPMGSLRRSDISAFVVVLTQRKLASATVLTIYPILALVRRSAVHDRLLARELSSSSVASYRAGHPRSPTSSRPSPADVSCRCPVSR